MTQYVLSRQPSAADGTLGELADSTGAHLCFTCELPWRDNTPDLSCIPPGVYDCIPHNSTDHPNTWELQDVPGRSAILIHSGNTEKDSLGCIVVGSELGTLDGLPAVLNSKVTLKMLQATLPGNFTLEVRWAAPLMT